MNEQVDILLTAAKLATSKNPWAHLATHVVSMTYNASMLWYYNYQLGMAQAMGPAYIPAEQIKAMKQERIKHSALLLLESATLLVAGICSLQENKRQASSFCNG